MFADDAGRGSQTETNGYWVLICDLFLHVYVVYGVCMRIFLACFLHYWARDALLTRLS